MNALQEELKNLRDEQLKLMKNNANYDRVMNEGGYGFNPFESKLSDITDRITQILQQQEDDEWTLVVTKERRLAWNDWVKSFGGKPIKAEAITAHVKEVGYGPEVLKRQIKRHGL